MTSLRHPSTWTLRAKLVASVVLLFLAVTVPLVLARVWWLWRRGHLSPALPGPPNAPGLPSCSASRGSGSMPSSKTLVAARSLAAAAMPNTRADPACSTGVVTIARPDDAAPADLAALEGYATATDLADYLVKKGLPFRDAHETVAHAVKLASQKGVDLTELPLDKLKIDGMFVRTLEGDPESLAIVRAIVHLAQALGLETTAEGVESAAQLQAVRELGCTDVQGFLTARPMPAEQVAPYLQALHAPPAATPAAAAC